MSIQENSSNDPLLNRLQELEWETDYEFVIELIDLYINETPKHIQLITSALHAQDYSALTIAAHTLKGSSLNLGAQHMGALCLKLEELGRSKSQISSEINTNEIEREFELIKLRFETFKKCKN
jgi:two-component system, sensor histidine kinase and response regulator